MKKRTLLFVLAMLMLLCLAACKDKDSLSKTTGLAGNYRVSAIILNGERWEYADVVAMGMAEDTYLKIKEDCTGVIAIGDGEEMSFELDDRTGKMTMDDGTELTFITESSASIGVEFPDLNMTIYYTTKPVQESEDSNSISETVPDPSSNDGTAVIDAEDLVVVDYPASEFKDMGNSIASENPYLVIYADTVLAQNSSSLSSIEDEMTDMASDSEYTNVKDETIMLGSHTARRVTAESEWNGPMGFYLIDLGEDGNADAGYAYVVVKMEDFTLQNKAEAILSTIRVK